MCKILKQTKGFAMMTVLVIFLTLFILLTALLMMSLDNQSNTLKGNSYSKAYYIAESALNIRGAQLNQMFYSIVEDNPDSNELFAELEYQFSLLPEQMTFSDTTENDYASFTLSSSEGSDLYPDYLFYTLTSVGTVNGTSRTLTQDLGFYYIKGGPGLIIGKAVLTQRGMIIGNQNSTVIGPIASNLLDGTKIDIKSTQAQIPMAYVPTGKTSSVINPSKIGNRITEVATPYVFPTISYPVIPSTAPTIIPAYTFVNNQATINVFGYSYLENLTMADGQTLIVNLGTRGTASTRKMLKVKNINASGKIRVIGTGRLLLVFEYGNGVLNLGPKFSACGNTLGTCQSAVPDYTKFLFYLKTPHITFGDIGNYQTLTFSNLQVFYGSILGENVNVAVKSDNFKGHIVTAGNTVDFSANATINESLFYAPFATITIDSNANLTGSLVANYFVISNPQTVVEYVEVNKETFPFNIDFPVTEVSDYVSGSATTIEGTIIER